MEIIQCNEGFKVCDGVFAFHCMKGIVRMDGGLHLASWKRRTGDGVERSELFDVQPLRTEDRGPTLQPDWSVVADPASPGYHVKAAELWDYASDELEGYMRQEIEMCEILRRHPHPNIALYYGCCANCGRATALCFKKYKATLMELVNPQHLDKRQFMLGGRPSVSDDIRSGLVALQGALNHLHSLGFAHNDVNPMNVMMDGESGTWVLVDFGSCRRIGESLQATKAKRTHGWHDPNMNIASAMNDWEAFEELMVWLSGPVDKLHW
ncbi:kinase-like domain-containing protein [Xylaria sp. FL0064]|nr:kinase-like domain-containing protein [Xylaria sp. FL0064]